MAKRIPLTKGMFATVDDNDYKFLNQWKWFCSTTGYAVRTVKVDGKNCRVRMHRVVIGVPEGMYTDHINMDRLDNRKENLRVVNKSQNGMNRKVPSNSSTGYKGVSFRKDTNKYRAYVSIDRKRVHIGDFKNILDAAKKYNEVAKKIYGQYANLNIIKE